MHVCMLGDLGARISMHICLVTLVVNICMTACKCLLGDLDGPYMLVYDW